MTGAKILRILLELYAEQNGLDIEVKEKEKEDEIQI